jgi:hypothetical protein
MSDGVEQVVAGARRSDPSLDPAIAREMSARAIYLAEHQAEPDAPAVARELLSDYPEYSATTANVVAKAATDYVALGVTEPEH